MWSGKKKLYRSVNSTSRNCPNYCISMLCCQQRIVGFLAWFLMSKTFSSSSSSTRFRLWKQNMCTVRGELCIVSGSTRLLYKLWTSFGYAWAQMLCSMPQKHVRNGGFQVSNIFASNFCLNMIVKTSRKFLNNLEYSKASTLLSEKKKALKLVSIGANAKRKQKHKRATFIFQ